MTELATTQELAVSPWNQDAVRMFFEDAEELEELDSFAKSPNTLARYCSNWSRFVAWSSSRGLHLPECDEEGKVDLPDMVPTTVVRSYIKDMQGVLKSATIESHLSAIKHFHAMAALPSPTDFDTVKRTKSALKRKHKYKPRQANAIRLATLQGVLPAGDDIKATRDRALMVWGFWSAMRRSEIVSMQLENFEFTDAGAVYELPMSKTDQTGEGQQVAVNHQHAETCPRGVKDCDGHKPCPVCELRSWLKVADIGSGPIWRGVDRHGNVRGDAISAQSVSLVLKEMLEGAGVNPAKYSAHSLRAGFISTMDEHGVPSTAIRAVTRHKSEAVMNGYSRPEKLLRESAGAYLVGSPLSTHDEKARQISEMTA